MYACHCMVSEYLAPAEVADALGISRARVYKLIGRGKLPAIRLSERSLRVSRLALDAYRRRLQAGLQPDHRVEVELEVRRADPTAVRQSFEAATGATPAERKRRWESDQLDDTAENMALAMDADWLLSFEQSAAPAAPPPDGSPA